MVALYISLIYPLKCNLNSARKLNPYYRTGLAPVTHLSLPAPLSLSRPNLFVHVPQILAHRRHNNCETKGQHARGQIVPRVRCNARTRPT